MEEGGANHQQEMPTWRLDKAGEELQKKERKMGYGNHQTIHYQSSNVREGRQEEEYEGTEELRGAIQEHTKAINGREKSTLSQVQLEQSKVQPRQRWKSRTGEEYVNRGIMKALTRYTTTTNLERVKSTLKKKDLKRVRGEGEVYLSKREIP
ncbi:unnamed protein product [Linum trigynum]|uniref:Uncharacterized protein n=1 Tax=Linum trigynum TaxID=586398 RepID=A0AAV2EVI3_9ROSI